MSEQSRKSPFAQVMAALILGFICLMGIGLSLQGLWIVGAPIAVVTGIMLIRTLLGRTQWKGGGTGDGPGEDISSFRE